VTRRKLLCGTMGLLSLAPRLALAEQDKPPARATTVSLIRLIANPNFFEGRRVRLVGYLAFGFGMDRTVGLHLSETDVRNAILVNSIEIRADWKRLEPLLESHVILEGTYNGPPGVDSLMAEYNGHVDQISLLKPWRYGDP
jgi:hypothetical protein